MTHSPSGSDDRLPTPEQIQQMRINTLKIFCPSAIPYVTYADKADEPVHERIFNWKEAFQHVLNMLIHTDKALQSLTPGGSEYVNNAERCVALVKEQQRDLHEAKKKIVLFERDRRSPPVSVGEEKRGGAFLLCAGCNKEREDDWMFCPRCMDRNCKTEWRDAPDDTDRLSIPPSPILDGWNDDMEKAPVGKILLLWAATDRDETGRITNWKMATGVQNRNYDGELEWRWDGSRLEAYDHKPTHWRPLPIPPTGGKE